RTASFKTMWGLNHLRSLVKRRPESAFLIVEMEMPREQLIRRLLRMDYNRSDELLDIAIKDGTISLDRFCETYRHLYFVDQGAISLSQPWGATPPISSGNGETRPLKPFFWTMRGSCVPRTAPLPTNGPAPRR